MTCKSPEYMVMLVIESLKCSGMRGIVQGGWAHLSMDTLKRATADASLLQYAEKNVLFVEKASHEWLFPLCCATVHHGGAGTLMCAVRAGVPTIITPVFLDQFDHAYLINRLGNGIGFKKQFQKIKSQDLADAIKKVCNSCEIRSKAAWLKQEVLMQDGQKEVIEQIMNFWVDWVETGKFKALVQARMA